MTTKAQRESKEFAHSVMTIMLPDPDIRKQWLDVLADSIIHADACDESGMKWGVVLHKNGVSLNVGENELLVLGRSITHSAYLTIDTECLSRRDRQELERNSIVVGNGVDDLPSLSSIHIPLQSLTAVLSLIKRAHLKSIEKATKNREFYFLQLEHSPGVIDYLRTELEREDIPDHRYVQADNETPLVIRRLIDITSHTKNVILYGPSGTGKTYWAHEFARSVFSDKRRITFVTFHQSFTYESFVEGLRASREDDGRIRYLIKDGIFKRICRQAKADPENDYLLIIDEINRANIAKVFGELITLIEDDKRLREENEVEVKLPYSQDAFGIPSNLYILGTMNTADRSLVPIDPVLRRRFTFIEILPEPSLLDTVDGVRLPALLTRLNQRITRLLGRNHQIGHSYLLGIRDVSSLHMAWYHRIVPLIQEYCYNDGERMLAILGDTFVQSVILPRAMPASLHQMYNPETPGYQIVFLEGRLFLKALQQLAGATSDEQ